jgi:hypothetical protein
MQIDFIIGSFGVGESRSNDRSIGENRNINSNRNKSLIKNNNRSVGISLAKIKKKVKQENSLHVPLAIHLVKTQNSVPFHNHQLSGPTREK